MPQRESKRLQMASNCSEAQSSTRDTLAMVSPSHTAPIQLTLDTLPTEILMKIFWCAMEPALLHMNRRFWDLTRTQPTPILPTYRDFTEKLAGLAICGGKDWLAPGEVDMTANKTLALFSLPDSGLESTLKECLHRDRRKEVQVDVFTSLWFGAKQMDKIHGLMFQIFVRNTLMDPSNNISSGQIRKIHKMLRETTTLIDSPSWTMLLSRAEGGKTTWKISEHEIRSTKGGRSVPCVASVWQILDFEHIPSELLRLPIDEPKVNTLRRLTSLKKVPICLLFSPKFDLALMKPALEAAIVQACSPLADTTLLRCLLAFGSMGRDLDGRRVWPREGKPPTHFCRLDFEHLRTAALAGHFLCVSILVDHSPIVAHNMSEVGALVDELLQLETPDYARMASVLKKRLNGGV
jgi:hypothetical protein